MGLRAAAALCFLVCATVAFAAAPPAGADRIRKHDGTVLVGTIVSELEKGYLFRTNAGVTLRIPYVEVAEVTKGAPGPAPTAPQPGPPPPPPPPTPEPAGACVPDCRAGFLCVAGTCQSACNPPCENGLVCSGALRCVDRDEADDIRIGEERKAHLDAVESDSAGLHWGALVAFDFGEHRHPSCADGRFCFDSTHLLLSPRAAAVANYRLRYVDIRGSLGVLVLVCLDDCSTAVGVSVDVDLYFRLGSRFALGLGSRLGVAISNVSGAMTGVKVFPAVFLLGSRRNLELSIVGIYSTVTNGDRYFSGGVQVAYLFY